MKTVKTLRDLFLGQLADMYDAETRLTQALPRLAKAATNDDLRLAFTDHVEETKAQLTKLERVFRAFGEKVKLDSCDATIGLIKEADHLLAENKGSTTLNAALICAAQKIEHYEIATYGVLEAWARRLGNSEAADLIAEILDEEKTADERLSELAIGSCNDEADQEAPDPEHENAQAE